MQGMWVQSLVRELRLHMLQGIWAYELQLESQHQAQLRPVEAKLNNFFLKKKKQITALYTVCLSLYGIWGKTNLVNTDGKQVMVAWEKEEDEDWLGRDEKEF